MGILKQSTVYNRPFLMVLSSDHVSPATGKTVTVNISKNGGSFNAALGAVSEIANGWYNVALTAFDTNTIASPPGFATLAFNCTASGCDNSDFTDQVFLQTFADIVLNANGRVMVSDNLQQNTALNGFTFMMVDSTTSVRKTGLSVTAQRTLGGGGFAPTTNSVTEITGTGIYTINLAAADLNNATAGILFTASGAADLYLPLVTTP